MTDVTTILALVLFGLVFGSYAGATVWRLRARQLFVDKKNGEEYDKAEYKRLQPLMNRKTSADRSQCLNCGYTLRWYDLIPLFSWLSLRGKCRSCKKPIGRFEPLIEVGTAALFVASFLLWPYPLDSPIEIAVFILWLIAAVGLVILFAYDARWFLLPDLVTFTVVAIAAVMVVLRIISTGDVTGILLNTFGSVGVLGGLYLVLYLVSKGRWIGFGDVKLGLALGLLLMNWQLGLLALFLANFIGCLIVIPLLLTKRLERNAHVPFGPLLIAGTVLALFIGMPLIDWYAFSLI